MGGLTVTLHRSIHEIGRDAWTELAGAVPLDHDHDYLAFVGTRRPHAQRYLACRAADGRLVGALPALLADETAGFFVQPRALLTDRTLLRDPADEELRAALPGDARGDDPDPTVRMRAWITRRLLPALVVSSMESTRILLATRLDGPGRRAVLDALLDGLRAHAGAGGWRSVVLLGVVGDDRELTRALEARGSLAARWSAVSAFEGLDGLGCLDDHFARLGPTSRKGFRREVRRFSALGLTTRTISLDEHGPRVAALEAAVAARHGTPVDSSGVERFNAQLHAHLGERLRAVGCFDGQELVAATTGAIGHDGSLVQLSYGADPLRAPRGLAYPCLALYEGIEHALATGLGRVALGVEAYEAKCRRGATLEPRDAHWLVDDPAVRAGLGRWLELVDRRNRDFLARAAEHWCTVLRSSRAAASQIPD